MASNALLLLGTLASIVAAIIPPCLPQLGPEFCPSTAAATMAAPPKWPTTPITYPDQMHHEQVLQDLVFPRINKTRIIDDTKFFTTNDSRLRYHFKNRHCNSSYGAEVEPLLALFAKFALDEAFKDVPNSTHTITFSTITNKTPQRSLLVKFLPEGNWNRTNDVIVIGAHIDSINSKDSLNGSLENMVAPGADDNASAFVVVFHTMKALASLFLQKRVLNEVQFHF